MIAADLKTVLPPPGASVRLGPMDDAARTAAAAWRRDPTPKTEAALVVAIQISPRRWRLPDDTIGTSRAAALDAWRGAELRGGPRPGAGGPRPGSGRPRGGSPDAARHPVSLKLTDEAKAVWDAHEGPSKSQWVSRLIVAHGVEDGGS